MSDAMSDPIRYEKRGHVAILTLDRPEARNALTPRMLCLLADAFVDFRADAALRVAILTGAGDIAFCAGGDLATTLPLMTGARAPADAFEQRMLDDPLVLAASSLRDFALAQAGDRGHQRRVHGRGLRDHAGHRHPRCRRACELRPARGAARADSLRRLDGAAAPADRACARDGVHADGPADERRGRAAVRPRQPRGAGRAVDGQGPRRSPCRSPPTARSPCKP
jgi:hypothetical protein